MKFAAFKVSTIQRVENLRCIRIFIFLNLVMSHLMDTDYNGKDLILESSEIKDGSVCWRSPSNIALVKYWGKYGNQLPCNPSLSFTLTEAYTETKISYSEKTSSAEKIDLKFYFEGKENRQFAARIQDYFRKLLPLFPFIGQLSFTINSENTFPHSAGIASSASAMSAIALCLCTIEDRFFGTLESDEEYERKASYVSRLGSGSACRSIFAEAALWGEIHSIEESSDEYGIPMAEGLHDIFNDFRDTILIVDKSTKAVSSSAGHKLMEGHPYAETRFNQADKHCSSLIEVLRKGDLEKFIEIVETEALNLHALMMMSQPSFILMEPSTISIIQEVRKFRNERDIPLCFTLDAGPNVHLLYPAKCMGEVELFIKEKLLRYCEEDVKLIKDSVGAGPLEI